MADVVDLLLNDAIDFHVQAVNHHWNPATITGVRQARFRHWSESGRCRNLKISTGIRQRLATVAGFRRYYARFRPNGPEWSDPRHLAGIMLEWPGWLGSGTNGQILATLKTIF
jgi:hypothetical protein